MAYADIIEHLPEEWPGTCDVKPGNDEDDRPSQQWPESFRQRGFGLVMLSAPSVTLRSSPDACTAIFSAKKRASAVRAGAVAAVAQCHERLFRQHAAAGAMAEQPQVRRGAGERGVGGFLRQQPMRRAFERVDRFAEPRRGFAKGRSVARLHRADGLAQFVDIERDRFAAFQRHLARHQIERLDAVGAFVDRGNARVALVLGGAGLFDEAHAAMHLYAERSDLDADIGGEGFGDRRQQRGALVRGFARRLVLAAVRAVERDAVA